MLINNLKKFAFFSLITLSFFILSSQVFATELKYTTIVSDKDGQVLFRSGGLEKTNIFICQLANLSCENVGSTTPPVVSESFTNHDDQDIKIKNVKFDRTNATRVLLSPDEKWLVYYDAALANKEKIRKFVLINLIDGVKNKAYELTGKVNYWDLLSEELRIFNFSPSGDKLMYLDDKNGYSVPYLVYLTGTPPKGGRLPGQQVILKKYSVADFIFLNDEVIYFSANRESKHTWSLYRYNLITKDLKKMADNVSYNQKMRLVSSGEDKKLLFMQVINNSSIPALLDPETSAISHFPALSANPKTTGYTEKEVTLGKLGGVLLKPSNYSAEKKYPLIIWLHGGPYRQAALGYHSYLGYAVYDWMLGELAKNGALVLKLDYRGSYGYGRSFAESITGQVGKGDVTDVLNAQTELKKFYKISNTYLVGNSYGGYLALRTIVDPQASKKIAGVLSINGVTDWFVLLDRLENSIFNVQFKGLLGEENSNLYYQADIADRVKNLKGQKIIVAQASNDNTVPSSQADYLAKIFNLKGKQMSLVKYAGEDHVFKKKSSLEGLCQQLASLSGIKAGCVWGQ
ncbi:MAG: prolyl oligopeptidase family serine peptidase [Candidatus Paceibacterota bacterium]|jgi:predicted peptidase